MNLYAMFKKIEDRHGHKRMYNIDYKNGDLVISKLLTGYGNEKPFKNSDITEKINAIPDQEWYDMDGASTDEIIRTLNKYNIDLPRFYFGAPKLIISYNDPCSDLMAYWPLKEVYHLINLEYVGHNSNFSVDCNNFFNKEINIHGNSLEAKYLDLILNS